MIIALIILYLIGAMLVATLTPLDITKSTDLLLILIYPISIWFIR
jgi:hypothetical protein